MPFVHYYYCCAKTLSKVLQRIACTHRFCLLTVVFRLQFCPQRFLGGDGTTPVVCIILHHTINIILSYCSIIYTWYDKMFHFVLNVYIMWWFVLCTLDERVRGVFKFVCSGYWLFSSHGLNEHGAVPSAVLAVRFFVVVSSQVRHARAVTRAPAAPWRRRRTPPATAPAGEGHYWYLWHVVTLSSSILFISPL